jgi:hypothetical protein
MLAKLILKVTVCNKICIQEHRIYVKDDFVASCWSYGVLKASMYCVEKIHHWQAGKDNENLSSKGRGHPHVRLFVFL